MALVDQIREFWDADASSYDQDSGHHPTTPLERAAWRGALERLLPGSPGNILDVGAGTGFLSLLAAELGHQVTAVDLSPAMLARLVAKAAAANLQVEVVEGDATAVPPGPFDAVVSRHLLWTLPDPAAALRAWRAAVPHGRLVLIDGVWRDPTDSAARVRRLLHQGLTQFRGTPPAHHGEYPPEVTVALPLGRGASPETLVELAAAAGWTSPRIERLTDVEWAARRGLPWPERLLGVVPRFAVVAGAGRR